MSRKPGYTKARRPKTGKRRSYRVIRAARSYSIEEAASALGVTIWTIRNWTKRGLRIMKSERPSLILGQDLREFLVDRTETQTFKLKTDELLCLGCKVGRKPMGLLVDLVEQSAKIGRLEGLCEVCGGPCNRIISLSKIDDFDEVFDLAFRGKKTA